jgi:hypothetical protein
MGGVRTRVSAARSQGKGWVIRFVGAPLIQGLSAIEAVALLAWPLAEFMGRKRRGGYFFVWFKGDHPPRHVHVFDSGNRLLGRVRLDTMVYLEGSHPPAEVVAIIKQFKEAGIL